MSRGLLGLIGQARLQDPGGLNGLSTELIGEVSRWPLTEGVLGEAASDVVAIEAALRIPEAPLRWKRGNKMTDHLMSTGNAETIRRSDKRKDQGIEQRVTRSKTSAPSPGLAHGY